MDEELEDIQCGLHKHEEELEYLKNQSRRNNVHIDGISEEDNETRLNTETKAKEVPDKTRIICGKLSGEGHT